MTVEGSDNYVNIDGFVVSGAGFGVAISGSFSTVYVGLGGSVTNLNIANVGIFDTGSGNTIIVDGSVSGGFPIGLSGDDGQFINRGLISSTATFSSGHAVGIRADNVSVLNEGSITAVGYGVSNFSEAPLGSSLVNTGVISGTIGVFMDAGTDFDVINSGTITGFDGTAIEVSSVNTRVENSGVINGDVLLTGNGVLYQGRADGVVHGVVLSGTGEDELIGGSREDYFLAEEGSDDLRGRAGDDILAGGRDNDLVAGNQGDDRVDGNQGDDTLFGNRGDDIVRGGSGNDQITGGRGDDVLTGNSGADIFIFGRRTDDDIITDFKNNFDKLDLTAYGLENVQALRDAGAIMESGAGSVIDLRLIGGDGVIYVEDMAVTDWTGLDFFL